MIIKSFKLNLDSKINYSKIVSIIVLSKQFKFHNKIDNISYKIYLMC